MRNRLMISQHFPISREGNSDDIILSLVGKISACFNLPLWSQITFCSLPNLESMKEDKNSDPLGCPWRGSGFAL